MNNMLKKTIIDEIGYPHKTTFCEFMRLALYHPVYGYYNTESRKIGKEGDFYTSPHAHPAFGQTVADFLIRSAQHLSAETFHIVEMGGGMGHLAADILDSIRKKSPVLYGALRYALIEPSPAMRKSQSLNLERHKERTVFTNNLEGFAPASVSGVIISNELVDSLPFHRAVWTKRGLREIYVSWKGGEFVELLDEPSSSDIADYFTDYFEGYGLSFVQGQEVEVNLEAAQWMRKASDILKEGLMLTVDYGFLAPELFSPKRMKGTYRCFYKHSLSENPYERIGEQDITAHVDFSNLIRVGDRCGLSALKYSTQGQFLVDWGILDIAERYAQDASLTQRERERNIAAIKTLFMPEFMGAKFRVLVQSKNMEGRLDGFYPPSPFRITPGEPD